MVEGELQSRNWKISDGNHNNVVELRARRIQFLNRRDRDEEFVDLSADEQDGKGFAHPMKSCLIQSKPVSAVKAGLMSMILRIFS